MQRIFAFHNQPGSAQQRVGDNQTDAAEQVKRRQPVKLRTAKGSPFHLKTAHHRPHHNPLGKGRQD
ncbi:Uncharacterised protein [Salmonella enterica subsp. enterica serovar Bovismorbificans]|nr:Uncharacterised protein [Salmonella enterica subsp. enterica serovar Bovismorbificans]